MKKLVLSLSILLLSVAACTKKEKEETPAPAAQQQPEIKDLLMQVATPAKDKKAKEAVEGKTLKVHYKGTFLDGKEFDSSYSRDKPFEFKLGAKQVIQGWEIGTKGMKVGEKRILVVPPQMAYGEQGAGPIPPNTPLRFEIELLDVK